VQESNGGQRRNAHRATPGEPDIDFILDERKREFVA